MTTNSFAALVCFHAGNPKQDGEFWAKRLNDGTCFQCTCKNSVVDCLVAVCQKCSYGMQPQEVPGKCCPVCAPGEQATTTITTTKSDQCYVYLFTDNRTAEQIEV